VKSAGWKEDANTDGDKHIRWWHPSDPDGKDLPAYTEVRGPHVHPFLGSFETQSNPAKISRIHCVSLPFNFRMLQRVREVGTPKDLAPDMPLG
jgi:hypothetical protein